MATTADVRRIALALPEAEEEQGRFAFGNRVKGKLKGFAWVWLERLDPKKARVPNPKVHTVRVANRNEKKLMIAAKTVKFFSELHYNGYPSDLVRLSEDGAKDLQPLLD